MNTLFVVLAAEFLFCVFFTKYAKVFHGALLLLVCKVLFPVAKSLVMHLCWRIPKAIINRHFQGVMEMHLKMWFGNKYSTKHSRVFIRAMPTIDEFTHDIINPNGKPADLDKELKILVKREGGRNG